MSTNHSSPNGQKITSTSTNQTTLSGSAKKRKSPGFIETSGFKPNWLETGPLTPEILRDSLNIQDTIEPIEDEATPIEAELVAEEAALEEQSDPQPQQTHETTLAPQATEVEEQSPPNAADEQPEEWVQALFENDNRGQSAESSSAIAMEEILWAEPVEAEHNGFIVETTEEVIAPETEEESFDSLSAMEAAFVAGQHGFKEHNSRRVPGLLWVSLIILGLAAIPFFFNPRPYMLQLISYILIGLAALLLLIVITRSLILGNDSLQMEHGCPQCGQYELMRVSRRARQRWLNMVGIPAYRYRCRNCTWEGTRLSEMGEAFSRGSLFGSHADDL
ncbi:MAG: transposase family protein [Candidatus Promineofilum sp.]|nr:transposase family protein [Promineifilum sp.]